MAGPLNAYDRPRTHLRTSDAEIAILTATERLLAHAPLSQLSVAGIMTEADVARGTFYHYFGSKYSVVTALMARVSEELYTTLVADLDRPHPPDSADPAAALQTALRHLIERWAAHRAVLRAISEHWRAVPELHDIWRNLFTRFADAVASRIDDQRAAGLAPPGPDSRALTTALVHGSERCLYVAGLGVDPDFPDEQAMAPHVIRMWTGGLYSPRFPDLPAPAEPDSPTGFVAVTARPGNEAAILHATEKLLDTTPLTDLSVRQIYDAAEIGRTTFYRHFGSKLDVVTALVHTALEDAYRAFQDLDTTQQGELADTLPHRLTAMSAIWSQHRVVLRAAMEGWQQVPELRRIWLGIIDRYGDAVSTEIDAARATGKAPAGLPSRPLAKALAWMTESCMYIAGLGVEPQFPDEPTAARTAAAISLGAVYESNA